MLVRVWEYDVPEPSRPEFERVYGPGGDWARLFASSDGFEGTDLFVSGARPGLYLTVDRFRDIAVWERFLVEHGEAYAALDARTEGLTSDERELVGPVSA